MRLFHVVSSLSSAGGGPSYTVPALAQAQSDLGADVTVGSLGETVCPSKGSIQYAASPQKFGSNAVLKKLGIAPNLKRLISAQPVDLIHSHGLWQMPGIYAADVAQRKQTPLVVSPRGMLSKVALGFSPTPKKVFSSLFQNRALRNVSLFHATSEMEYEDLRNYGLRQPVVIAPNGVDVPTIATTSLSSGTRTVLTLGRIHPKKGLDILLNAWAKVENRHPDWRLRIVGPDEQGHADELKALAIQLKLKRVQISGPSYGEAKWNEYGAANLFVLPTRSENFAVTVAESLGAGVPVISTKGAPWQGLEMHCCGWWIDHGVEPLVCAFEQAMSLSDVARTEMGRRGREWIDSDFSWDRIAQDMLVAYRWLANGGEIPPQVRVD